MDIVIIIIAAILLLAGVVGCVIPIIPGPPIAYVGMLIMQLTDKYNFSVSQLIIWGIATAVVVALDYIAPTWGTKLGGGSTWGKWGCFLGTIIGLFCFPPLGIIIGPFVGAVIGELLHRGKSSDVNPLKAGLGSFLGFMLGFLAKLLLCIYFIWEFVHLLL